MVADFLDVAAAGAAGGKIIQIYPRAAGNGSQASGIYRIYCFLYFNIRVIYVILYQTPVRKFVWTILI